MDAESFLRSTPVEINWKVEAHNTAKEESHRLAYTLGRLSSLAFAEKFPTFTEAFPAASESDEEEAVDDDLETAIEIAKELGHPTGSF